MVTKKDVIISNDLRSLFDTVGKPRFQWIYKAERRIWIRVNIKDYLMFRDVPESWSI